VASLTEAECDRPDTSVQATFTRSPGWCWSSSVVRSVAEVTLLPATEVITSPRDRPAESAGAYEGFRKMNRSTREMPEEAAHLTAKAKTTYLEAIRDWVRHGSKSPHAFSAEQARAHLPALTEDAARAQAFFRLSQALLRRGRRDEAERMSREASRLWPDSWCIWRQSAGVNEMGFAALPDFWQRVDALGEDRYYARVDMPGMP